MFITEVIMDSFCASQRERSIVKVSDFTLLMYFNAVEKLWSSSKHISNIIFVISSTHCLTCGRRNYACVSVWCDPTCTMILPFNASFFGFPGLKIFFVLTMPTFATIIGGGIGRHWWHLSPQILQVTHRNLVFHNRNVCYVIVPPQFWISSAAPGHNHLSDSHHMLYICYPAVQIIKLTIHLNQLPLHV